MSNLGNKEIMAKNLNRLIERRGLNKKDFSAELGVPYTTVLGWTNAETYPRIDKIEMMANYFGVTKSDLVEPYTQESQLNEYQEILFDTTQEATPEDMENIIAMVKAYMRKK